MIYSALCAQNVNAEIAKGNDAYKKGDLNTAIESYKNALRKDSENSTARFNLANALEKQNQIVQSRKTYDDLIAKADDNDQLKSESNYNKALTYVKQQDLQNAITYFKSALVENPSDDDARENLQKAMNDLKKQQQQNQPKNKKQPPQNNPKQKKQQQMSQQMMEQKLNELRNEENQLQKKLQAKTSTSQPDKDW